MSTVMLCPAIRFNVGKTALELAEFAEKALKRANKGFKESKRKELNNSTFYVRRQHVLASIAETEIILRKIFS